MFLLIWGYTASNTAEYTHIHFLQSNMHYIKLSALSVVSLEYF